MVMQCTKNIQVVELFEETTSTNWTFNINWIEKTILIYRGNVKLVQYTDCKFPPTVSYLQSLVTHFKTVRTQL